MHGGRGRTREITRKAVVAARDPEVNVVDAARLARRALIELPGASIGDAFASAMILAAAPERMAYMTTTPTWDYGALESASTRNPVCMAVTWSWSSSAGRNCSSTGTGNGPLARSTSPCSPTGRTRAAQERGRGGTSQDDRGTRLGVLVTTDRQHRYSVQFPELPWCALWHGWSLAWPERACRTHGAGPSPPHDRAAHTCYCRSAPASSTINSPTTSAAGTPTPRT